MINSILCAALLQTVVCTSAKRGLSADYDDEFMNQRQRIGEVDDIAWGVDEALESVSAALPDFESAIRDELTGHSEVEAIIPHDSLIRNLHRVVLPAMYDVGANFYTVPAAPHVVSAVRNGFSHLLRSGLDFASLINPQSPELSHVSGYFHTVAQRLHVPEPVFMRMLRVMETAPDGALDVARFHELFGDVMEGFSEDEIARCIQWYYEHLFMFTDDIGIRYRFEKTAGLVRPDREYIRNWAKIEIDRLVHGQSHTRHLPYPHFVRRLFSPRINFRVIEYTPVLVSEIDGVKFRNSFPNPSLAMISCVMNFIRPISDGDVTGLAGGLTGCGPGSERMNEFLVMRFSVPDHEFDKYILYGADEDRENNPDYAQTSTRVWFDILARTIGGFPRVADIPLYQQLEGGRVWPPLPVMVSIANSILREIWE
jgi:hypothetical protein